MDIGIIIFILFFASAMFFLKVYPAVTYVTAKMAGTPISFLELLRMRFSKTDADKVGTAYIMLQKANIDIKIIDLEQAFLSNRNLDNVTKGLISAKQKNVPMTFEQAMEADKKGIEMSFQTEENLTK